MPGTEYIHYKMNDNAATTVVADSGAANLPGTCSTNSSVVTTAGKINSALGMLAASSHNIVITNVCTAVRTDAAGSIACWLFTTTTAGGIMCLAATGSGGVAQFFLSLANDRKPRYLITNPSDADVVDVQTVDAIPSGSWVHVAVVQAGTGPTFYINGAIAAHTFSISASTGAWFSVGGASLLAGRLMSRTLGTGAEGSFLSARIDDFRYFQTAITSNDVYKLYNRGSGSELALDSIPQPPSLGRTMPGCAAITFFEGY